MLDMTKKIEEGNDLLHYYEMIFVEYSFMVFLLIIW